MLLVVSTLLVLAACTNGTTGNAVATEGLMSNGAQVVNLGLDRGGYTPREITVEAGKPVTLRNDGSLQGCALYAIQPELGINANFAKNSEYTVTPTKKGNFVFTCSMGMWKGTINVV